MLIAEGGDDMKIVPFEKNRHLIENQYEKTKEFFSRERELALYEKIKEEYFNAPSKQEGRGKAEKCFLENARLFINPADIFFDMTENGITPMHLRDSEKQRLNPVSYEANLMDARGAYLAGWDPGHTMPDWERILSLGIPGILKEAISYLEKDGLTKEQEEFYTSVKYAYEGILIYIKRLYELARETEGENAAFAAENLKALMEREPHTLAEAMQLYFIYYMVQHHVEGANLRSLGALDDLLYPFYKSDIEKGIITKDEARELIRYFLFKWTSVKVLANIPFNLCTHVTEMTYLILEEYIALDIMDPKIHIKWDEALPQDVTDIVMDAIRKGKSSFVFVNSPVVKKALMGIGEEEADAENYTLIGCYEPAAAGKEFPCTLNGRINLPMAIEVILGGGRNFSHEELLGQECDADYKSFDDFYSAIKALLKEWSEKAILEISDIERSYPSYLQAPIISATFESCMEKGLDAYKGGAKYNNSSICIFGTGSFADSLTAIKKLVFEEKRLTLKELVKVLKNNWEGYEDLRQLVKKTYPKYGNGKAEADFFIKEIASFMAECINGKENGRGGVFRMGMFSIDWILHYGRLLGASADGRLKGEAISKNLSPSLGMDKSGITGIINSATSFDHALSPNGLVLDLAVHPSAASGDEGLSVMSGVLKTYFKKGGFAVHFNVLSAEILKEAKKNPEKYKNLQVRLCGWNVYFADLDSEMQDNLIKGMEG